MGGSSALCWNRRLEQSVLSSCCVSAACSEMHYVTYFSPDDSSAGKEPPSLGYRRGDRGKGAGNWAWPRFEHQSLVPKTFPFPQEPRTPRGKAWVTRSRGDPSLRLPRGCCGFSAVGTWQRRVRHVQAGGEGPREVVGHLASGHHQKDAEQAGRLTPSCGSAG